MWGSRNPGDVQYQKRSDGKWFVTVRRDEKFHFLFEAGPTDDLESAAVDAVAFLEVVGESVPAE
jgi:hypothetical protein